MAKRRSSITGYLRGGLGNQMFIAAAAYAVSARLGLPLVLDTSFFDRKRQHHGDIDRIDLGAEIGSSSPSWLVAEPDRLRLLGRTPLRALGVFVEHSFSYDPRIERVAPGTTLVGYFQSWRYFHGVRDELRSRFLRISEPTEWFLQTRRLLEAEGDWIGIHVRQGDYLDPVIARKHGNVTGAFVERAVAAVRARGHGGRVVLFSDRPATAQRLHPLLDEALIIDPPQRSHPVESIALMATSSALISSNSSFSWWGAYLGDRAGRTVVSPRPWFGGLGHDTRDLLLPDWLTVDRREFPEFAI